MKQSDTLQKSFVDMVAKRLASGQAWCDVLRVIEIDFCQLVS